MCLCVCVSCPARVIASDENQNEPLRGGRRKNPCRSFASSSRRELRNVTRLLCRSPTSRQAARISAVEKQATTRHRVAWVTQSQRVCHVVTSNITSSPTKKINRNLTTDKYLLFPLQSWAVGSETHQVAFPATPSVNSCFSVFRVGIQQQLQD